MKGSGDSAPLPCTVPVTHSGEFATLTIHGLLAPGDAGAVGRGLSSSPVRRNRSYLPPHGDLFLNSCGLGLPAAALSRRRPAAQGADAEVSDRERGASSLLPTAGGCAEAPGISKCLQSHREQ